ncbi:hypothetical protein IQ268_21395 [Oculatella sp. LEGE 06141]|uniref:hypothetical protein n=1 Tax=Oculatella sp. LEGE 06141 TaxID=1828648 RepID=UPI00188172C3|nr:hypothetical protein [Oculatella sp. LEGE 06141]MBE9181120.1 hypothetical protein [Oculatella sp. LEGE 06141]
MTIEMLKQSYEEQLVKAGVEPQRAMEVAASITTEELALIGEIWADWAEVVRNTTDATLTSDFLDVN